MGSKGSQALAMRMLKTLPKLDDATILMYLIVLPCVMRPVVTQSTIIPSAFSVRMTSAHSFATLAPVSTEIPTSANLSATLSLMPSPRKPTHLPIAFSRKTTFTHVSLRSKTLVQ